MSGLAALVTGGANGIGAAAARLLADRGGRVTIADRDPAGQAVAEAIGARFVAIDASAIHSIGPALEGLGPFEALVNNIGVDQHAFFTDTGPEEWRRLLSLNLESAFAFTQAVLPAMQRAGFGRIVCVSSEAGRLGSRGGAVYAAAKAGMIGFARSIARENARYGITCNVVAPGPIETPMAARAIAAHGEKLRDAMAGLTLMRRLGRPEEVAEAIAFLASPAASFITGETLGVSGGMGCGAA